MANSNVFSRALAITGIATVMSVAGYAIYFDYQRRNNTEFRKSLKKKLRKQKKEEQDKKEEAKQTKLQDIREFLKDELTRNPIPTDPTQIQNVFSNNVELGEHLSMTPGNEMEAATKFYKALAVYPKPTDLLGIYQRTIPENIYEIIVLMIAVMPPTNITDFISGGMDGADALGIDEDEDEPLISEIIEEEEDEDEEEAEGEGEGIINTEDNADAPVAEETMDAEIEIINDASQDTAELADRIIEEFAQEVAADEEKEEEADN
ncbi:similar to Saccharomyces cerevisiae YGR082W TOM20 Component of the TOM (translocase of outer membrane) complex responsible for recognition and initial import steps for all mitochondrially directed proteins [Maudiozyma saulgeensis]|uniref:Similar to Saccharomyces cerevisiae YGR082W TOM20 Component of the TOM (Translocase of outer membrane) complex responsible for recognition and initial import steps for all mitochondrially directed... n=1 Tax=Maudiozyma saulgeensis TaxID=1789683 RepID=A0A1X7QXK8_9SACH|nr:similar to Saccharomyces cerevisiae YGR082W TOM20 Component of the TOM (translocase of outer membrane) complex responsible for recognition and initial import steps for all mitochondrially directed proteins [Kazachstania saulgeensis]